MNNIFVEELEIVKQYAFIWPLYYSMQLFMDTTLSNVIYLDDNLKEVYSENEASASIYFKDDMVLYTNPNTNIIAGCFG